MKVVLLTPLYPPDIAQPAPYVKELAARLQAAHAVTILTYGRLPERVEGVAIRVVDKRAPLPLRLMRFALALWQEARRADLVFFENGASVELPVLVVSRLVRTPFVMHLGDTHAHARARNHSLLRRLEHLAMRRAHVVLAEMPLPRPELLPFRPRPAEAFDAYEQSWQKHLALLTKQLGHV